MDSGYRIIRPPFNGSGSEQETAEPVEFAIQGARAGQASIERYPEPGAVVLDACMNEFVEKGVVDQPVRQAGEIHVEMDVISRGAASPPGFLPSDVHPVVDEAMKIRQYTEPFGQERWGVANGKGMRPGKRLGLLFEGGHAVEMPLEPFRLGTGNGLGRLEGNSGRDRHPNALERPDGQADVAGTPASLEHDVAHPRNVDGSGSNGHLASGRNAGLSIRRLDRESNAGSAPKVDGLALRLILA